MQVGISANVTGPQDAGFVRDAERLGAASVWVAEAWGQDALTPLAYLAAHTDQIALGTAIAQIGARTLPLQPARSGGAIGKRRRRATRRL